MSTSNSFATSIWIPSGVPREINKSIVWGNNKLETNKVLAPLRATTRDEYNKFIASAAAVASSKSEALAISIPVSSITAVW